MGVEKRLETSLGGYTCFGVQVRLRVPRFGVCACLGESSWTSAAFTDRRGSRDN